MRFFAVCMPGIVPVTRRALVTRRATKDESLKSRLWQARTTFATVNWVACLSLLLGRVAIAQAPAAEFNKFSSSHDRFFPTEMEAWQVRQEYISDGLKKADSLRSSLLTPDSQGRTGLERICQAYAEFKSASSQLLRDRPSIESFDLSAERLRRQLTGRETISPNSFDAFDGRWFGLWGESEVNHDWRPTQQFSPAKSFGGVPLRLQAIQYAWISNGFGWNYLASLGPADPESQKPNRLCVLGMVYYFQGDDFRQVAGEKAHVGFVEGPGRLVWITENEVFLEEAFPGVTAAEDTYVITAMYHDLLADPPTVSRRATQAVYTRDPERRPPFHEFRW